MKEPFIKYRKDLWKLIEGVQGDAAEVGVAEGRFASELLRWPASFPKVYLVDRWRQVPFQRGDASNPQPWHDKNLREARGRTQPFGNRAVFLIGDSVEMAKRVPDHSLAFAYIDGDHSEGGVMRDLQAWVPKVVLGGVVGLHDYENIGYGVKRAVANYCRGRFDVHVSPENKSENAGAWFRC